MKKAETTTTKKEKEVKEKDTELKRVFPEDVEYLKVINDLKRKHRRIYETEIAGEKILWRPLKRSEYKDVVNMEFPEDYTEADRAFDRETFIAKTVILYPDPEIIEDIAWAAEIITELCMDKSGFTDSRFAESKEV